MEVRKIKVSEGKVFVSHDESSFVEVSNPEVIVLQNGCLIGGYTPLEGFYPAPTELEMEVKEEFVNNNGEFEGKWIKSALITFASPKTI